MVAVPDELLMAYADGELTAEEAKALEQLLVDDATLRVRLEPFVETRIRLSYAFEHKLHEPVPDRLIAAIARASAAPARAGQPPLYRRIRDWARAAFTSTFPNGMSPALAAGAAALLVIASATGWVVGRLSAPQGLIEVAGSGLVASGALARALETSPSGAAADADAPGASIVPVLSFRTEANGVCREYRIKGSREFAGLACRTAEGLWRLALHVETPRASNGHGPYQTATAANVPAVDALTERLISGDAFGKDDEAALLENGWNLSPKH